MKFKIDKVIERSGVFDAYVSYENGMEEVFTFMPSNIKSGKWKDMIAKRVERFEEESMNYDESKNLLLSDIGRQMDSKEIRNKSKNRVHRSSVSVISDDAPGK